MKLINYTEKWVWEVLEEVLAEHPDVCCCEQCRYDMAALALNNLKPNYVISKHGQVYTKTKMLLQQNKTDVLTEVLKAVGKIHKNPHHLE